MHSFYKYHTFQWNLPQVQWMNRMYFIVLAHFAEKGETPVLLLEQITYVSEFYIYVFCHEMIRTNYKDSNNKFKIIIQVVGSMLLYSLKIQFLPNNFCNIYEFYQDHTLQNHQKIQPLFSQPQNRHRRGRENQICPNLCNVLC